MGSTVIKMNGSYYRYWNQTISLSWPTDRYTIRPTAAAAASTSVCLVGKSIDCH